MAQSKNKKQPAKKRAYKKRGNVTSKSPVEQTFAPLNLMATNKDTEVESLAAICSIFDNWDEEQKRRNLTYLCGRYYDFM